AHRVHEDAELAAGGREPIFDARRPRVDDAPFENPFLLELREALGKRARRDSLERLLELVEADGALLGGGPEDREHPAAPEEVCRTGDLLGQRPAALTPHAAESASARVRARAPHRASSRDGTTSPRARPRGRRRDRRGSAPG